MKKLLCSLFLFSMAVLAQPPGGGGLPNVTTLNTPCQTTGTNVTVYKTTTTIGPYYCGADKVWHALTGGTVGAAFSAITGSTNTTAAMIVGSGASLSYTGTGIINASKILGATLTGLTGPIKMTAGVPSVAVAADIIGLFSACSGVLYLGADGACHAAGGGSGVTSVATTSPLGGGTITSTGTITCTTCVTAAAALTDLSIMSGAGAQASKKTNITTDSGLNNLNVPGSISTGGSADTSCDGTAACIIYHQGTAPSGQSGANGIQDIAPTSVTSYRVIRPGTVGVTGIPHSTVSGVVRTDLPPSLIVAADITSATITGTQIASSIALAGSPTTTTQSAGDNSTKIATTAYADRMRTRAISFSIGDPTNSSALTTASRSATVTVPFACTISAYNLAFSPGDTGTITVKFWKVATGTAIPTVSDVINTSGVAIASGTAIHSTTVSDFTTTAVAANDMIAMAVTAVATTKSITGVLQCDIP